jgi:hypothetical protein
MGTGTGSKLIDIDGVQGVGQEFQNQMRRKTWCSIGNGLILAAPKGLEVNLQFKSRKREHRGAWRGAGSSQLAARSSELSEEGERRRSLGLAQAQTALSMPLSTSSARLDPNPALRYAPLFPDHCCLPPVLAAVPEH